MPIEQYLKQVTELPDNYVEMVVSYIRFLQQEANGVKQKKRKIGVLSDRFEFISPDFNVPLESFREYQ